WVAALPGADRAPALRRHVLLRGLTSAASPETSAPPHSQRADMEGALARLARCLSSENESFVLYFLNWKILQVRQVVTSTIEIAAAGEIAGTEGASVAFATAVLVVEWPPERDQIAIAAISTTAAIAISRRMEILQPWKGSTHLPRPSSTFV